MKLMIILTLAAVAAARPNDDQYVIKGNFDRKELVENVRLLKSYALCFNDKGKCTPEGNDIKKFIPEAIQTSCAKCTEEQKRDIASVINAMQGKLPDEWKALNERHDPDSKYQDDVKEFVAKYS